MLGAIRAKELEASAKALGVDHVTCLDLGDGRLAEQPLEDVAAAARTVIDGFGPDVVVTFGPDGGYGHPDHVTSCLATMEAARAMPKPPRLLHARFPVRGPILVDAIVEWLTPTLSASPGPRLRPRPQAVRRRNLDARLRRRSPPGEWFPAGSFIIEQGEPATQLFCILSGSAAIVLKSDDGGMHHQATRGAGCFVGEDGLAPGDPRRARHRQRRRDLPGARARGAEPIDWPRCGCCRGASRSSDAPGGRGGLARTEEDVVVDVRTVLDRKVAALAAHRSQYAMEPDLLPRSMLERILGTEHFVVAEVRTRAGVIAIDEHPRSERSIAPGRSVPLPASRPTRGARRTRIW